MTEPGELLSWLGRKLLDVYVLTPLFAVLTPLAVWTFARDFVRAGHPVPGWLILLASALVTPFVASLYLNIRHWRERRQPANLVVVPHGGDHAFGWDMQTSSDGAETMVAQGLYAITNLSKGNVSIVKTILEISYTRIGIIPARRRVEGSGRAELVDRGIGETQRLFWFVQAPPVRRGRAFQGRIILVDNLGHRNRSEWTTWAYKGGQ